MADESQENTWRSRVKSVYQPASVFVKKHWVYILIFAISVATLWAAFCVSPNDFNGVGFLLKIVGIVNLLGIIGDFFVFIAGIILFKTIANVYSELVGPTEGQK